MSCGAIASGDQFVSSTLKSLECSGKQLGEIGYQALAAPGSIVGSILLALLTLFIALQGARLMFAHRLDLGDASMAAIKIGLVLMLATSWPAVKTLFYDTAIKGPSEVVGQIGGSPANLVAQLQRIDAGMVRLTQWGTGKLDLQAGRTADGAPAAYAFSGEAMNESLGLSGGRLIFLVSVIGGLGAAWLGGGLLISLLPLFAGFLLFGTTRGLAMGWLRGWLFLFMASLSLTLILAIEASVIEPWLVRVLAERAADFATPSAPIELMAMTGAFGLIMMISLTLLGRLCFFADLSALAARWAQTPALRREQTQPRASDVHLDQAQSLDSPSRAYRLSQHLAQMDSPALAGPAIFTPGWQPSRSSVSETPAQRSPNHRRRTSQRATISSRKRDRQ